jgi:DNA-binding protein H-NS
MSLRSISKLVLQEAQIEKELAALRKRRELINLREQEILKAVRKKALGNIISIANAYGLDAPEIVAALNTTAPKGVRGKDTVKKSPSSKMKKVIGQARKVLPKYSNPENPEETWTGRGRSPAWIAALREKDKLYTALIVK